MPEKARVLTIGTFDIPHAGHAHFLRQSAKYGNLTVGVNTDKFVETYKGNIPVYTQKERQSLIEAMGYRAVLSEGPGRRCIRQHKPDIITISTDWLYPRDYLRQINVTEQEMRAWGIDLIFIPHTTGIGTTEIIERVAGLV